MRARLRSVWILLVVAFALLLPASTAAASAGKIAFHDGYCSGTNTVNGTFTVTKYSGVYGTKLTLTVKGQGYHNGAWRTEVSFGTWSKSFATSAKVSLSKFVSFKPGHAGRHRLSGVGKIWRGSMLVAKAAINTGTCG